MEVGNGINVTDGKQWTFDNAVAKKVDDQMSNYPFLCMKKAMSWFVTQVIFSRYLKKDPPHVMQLRLYARQKIK